MAANDYPGPYVNGTEIQRLDEANQVDGVTVFTQGQRPMATVSLQRAGVCWA